MRKGDMRKLIFHAEPMEVTDVAFTHEDGSTLTLADFQGSLTIVNFWATWCAPCRKEMPQLDALQTLYDPADLRVVTIATGRNPRPAMERFFAEIGVQNLPLHTDERQTLARNMGVLGLPATIILDREGREVGRLLGEADWANLDAQRVIDALLN